MTPTGISVWRDMDSAPHDEPILVKISRRAGEISGAKDLDGLHYAVVEGGPVRADVPGDGWWGSDGDHYATWVWPVAWRPVEDNIGIDMVEALDGVRQWYACTVEGDAFPVGLMLKIIGILERVGAE